jgi:predicted RNA-binding Zn-ribbon protein involved in translation (DUF1610 family)
MVQKTIETVTPRYETIVIPQEEIDKIVSPDDFIPHTRVKKKKLLKQIVHYMHCPTCGTITGHRRQKGTLNDYPCCVCGHTVKRFNTGWLSTIADIGSYLLPHIIIPTAMLIGIGYLLTTFALPAFGIVMSFGVILPLMFVASCIAMIFIMTVNSC